MWNKIRIKILQMENMYFVMMGHLNLTKEKNKYMYKLIAIDLDGTLWDTTIEVEKVWNKIAMEYELNISKEQIKNIMGLTKREII